MAAVRPDLRPYVDQKLTVVAWLWARTVKSPNPAFADVDVPLVSSFVLSSKKGKEAYVEPVFYGNEYRFVVQVGGLSLIQRPKARLQVNEAPFVVSCLASQ